MTKLKKIKNALSENFKKGNLFVLPSFELSFISSVVIVGLTSFLFKISYVLTP